MQEKEIEEKKLKLSGAFLTDLPEDYKYKNKVIKALLSFKKHILKPLRDLKNGGDSETKLTSGWKILSNGSRYCGEIHKLSGNKNGLGKEILENGDFLFGLFSENILKKGCVFQIREEKIIFVLNKKSKFESENLEKIEGDAGIIFLGKISQNWAYYGHVNKFLPEGFGTLYTCDILKKEQIIRGKAYKYIGRFERGMKRGEFVVKYRDSIKVKKFFYKENSEREEISHKIDREKIPEPELIQPPVYDYFLKIEEEDYLTSDTADDSFEERKRHEILVEFYDKINLFCEETFGFTDSSSDEELQDSTNPNSSNLEQFGNNNALENEKFGYELVKGKNIIEYYYKGFKLVVDHTQNYSLIISSNGEHLNWNLLYSQNKIVDNRNNSLELDEKSKIKSFHHFYSFVKSNLEFREVDQFVLNYLKLWRHQTYEISELLKNSAKKKEVDEPEPIQSYLKSKRCQTYEKYFPFVMKFYNRDRLFFALKNEEKETFILMGDFDFCLIAEILPNSIYKGIFWDKKQSNTMEGFFTFHPTTQKVIPIKGQLKSQKNDYCIDLIQTQSPTTQRVGRFIKKIKAVFTFGYTVELTSKKMNNRYQQLEGSIFDNENDEVYKGKIYQEKFNERNELGFMLYTEESKGFSFKDIKLVFIERIFSQEGEKLFEGQIFNIYPYEKGESGIFTYTLPPRLVDATIVNFMKNTTYKVKRIEGKEIIHEFEFISSHFKANFFDIVKNKPMINKCQFIVENPLFDVSFNNKIRVKKLIKDEIDKEGDIESFNLESDKLKDDLKKYFQIGNYQKGREKFPLKFKLDFSLKENIRLLISENKNSGENCKGVIMLKDGGIMETTFNQNFEVPSRNISTKRYELSDKDLQRSIRWVEGSLKGNFISGNKSKILYKNLACYEGNTVFERRHGRGNIEYCNSERYEGEWFDGLKHGYGIYKWPNGDCYEGEFSLNVINGEGVLALNNGIKLEGIFSGGDFVRGSVFSFNGTERKIL